MAATATPADAPEGHPAPGLLEICRPTRPRRLGGRARPRVLAAVAVGGALGAPARYALGSAVHISPGSFPWATFWINLSGSFLLGVVLTLVLERWPPTRLIRPFAATGFLGAYTTFSTFAVEGDLLIGHGHPGVGLAYLIGSVLAGLVAVWAGMVVARAWPRERRRA